MDEFMNNRLILFLSLIMCTSSNIFAMDRAKESKCVAEKIDILNRQALCNKIQALKKNNNNQIPKDFEKIEHLFTLPREIFQNLCLKDCWHDHAALLTFDKNKDMIIKFFARKKGSPDSCVYSYIWDVKDGHCENQGATCVCNFCNDVFLYESINSGDYKAEFLKQSIFTYDDEEAYSATFTKDGKICVEVDTSLLEKPNCLQRCLARILCRKSKRS
jgi:hypothetical protein